MLIYKDSLTTSSITGPAPAKCLVCSAIQAKKINRTVKYILIQQSACSDFTLPTHFSLLQRSTCYTISASKCVATLLHSYSIQQPLHLQIALECTCIGVRLLSSSTRASFFKIYLLFSQGLPINAIILKLCSLKITLFHNI